MRFPLRTPSVLTGARAFAALVSLLVALVLPNWPRVAWAYVPPAVTGWVNDPAKLLSEPDRARLAKKLEAHQQAKGHQIVVFVLPSLGGETVEDVAYGAFNGWKLGDRERDDGVLLLIAVQDRVARIETGKGVGGDLPDLETSRILRTAVTPNMKANDLPRALDEATSLIITKLGGTAAVVQPRANAPAAAPAKSAEEEWFSRLALPWKILIVIIVIILWLFFGGSSSGSSSSGGGGGGSSRFGGGGSSGGGGSNERW